MATATVTPQSLRALAAYTRLEGTRLNKVNEAERLANYYEVEAANLLIKNIQQAKDQALFWRTKGIELNKKDVGERLAQPYDAQAEALEKELAEHPVNAGIGQAVSSLGIGQAVSSLGIGQDVGSLGIGQALSNLGLASSGLISQGTDHFTDIGSTSDLSSYLPASHNILLILILILIVGYYSGYRIVKNQ